MSEESMLTEQEKEGFANGFVSGSPIGYTYEGDSESSNPWYAPWIWTYRDKFWLSEELSPEKNGELFAGDSFADLFDAIQGEKNSDTDYDDYSCNHEPPFYTEGRFSYPIDSDITDPSDEDLKDRENKYALISAAEDGDIEVIKSLSKSNDILHWDEREVVALILAAFYGHADVVKLLLEAGCDVNSEDPDHDTALVWASRAGHAEVVKVLLEAGADINRRYPLWDAVKEYHVEVVEVLLEAGYKSDYVSGNLVSLLYSEDDGGAEGAKTLLKSRPTDDTDRSNWDSAALKWTILCRYFEMTKVLIEAGVDVNAKDSEGMTALLWASLSGDNPELVKVLLDAGADISAKDEEYGRNALMWAANKDNVGIVNLLLKAGIDVNEKSKKGWTPLMMASEREGRTEELLLESGADVNAKNEDGETALMVASTWGNIGVIKHLLKARADINVKTQRGWTALIFAAQKNQYMAAELLIRAGIGINDKDNCGKTALMWAAQKGFYSTVRILIEAGADIGIESDEEETALHFALAREYPSYPDYETIEGFDKTIELLEAAQKS